MNKHNIDEEIELRLCKFCNYYRLQYRYKNRITLWEKLFGCKWLEPVLYNDFVIDIDENPNKYFFPITFNPAECNLVKELESLKQNIKTYWDFYTYFKLDELNAIYANRMEKYNKWYNDTYNLGNIIK